MQYYLLLARIEYDYFYDKASEECELLEGKNEVCANCLRTIITAW